MGNTIEAADMLASEILDPNRPHEQREFKRSQIKIHELKDISGADQSKARTEQDQLVPLKAIPNKNPSNNNSNNTTQTKKGSGVKKPAKSSDASKPQGRVHGPKH